MLRELRLGSIRSVAPENVTGNPLELVRVERAQELPDDSLARGHVDGLNASGSSPSVVDPELLQGRMDAFTGREFTQEERFSYLPGICGDRG